MRSLRCERCEQPPEDWLRLHRMPDGRILKLCLACIEDLGGTNVRRDPNPFGDRQPHDPDEDE
jgi:hypothetical protein